ncbi:MAG: DUF1801 domain-containing protein [Kofleriaceae bacterium]
MRSVPTTRRANAADVDAYLARVPPAMRAALIRLRKLIKQVAPAATETISYQIPAFRHHGMLVGFGATARQGALYVMSSTVLAGFTDELRNLDTAKGTLRFTVDAPLPAALVKRVVAARVAQNEARAAARGTPIRNTPPPPPAPKKRPTVTAAAKAKPAKAKPAKPTKPRPAKARPAKARPASARSRPR